MDEEFRRTVWSITQTPGCKLLLDPKLVGPSYSVREAAKR
jgi:hypothetical protein